MKCKKDIRTVIRTTRELSEVELVEFDARRGVTVGCEVAEEGLHLGVEG